MDSGLSEKQELLLFKACKDKNGVVTKYLAEKMYGSPASAKSAIEKLELFEYIESTAPGTYKVVKLPNDVKRELKNVLQDNGEENKAPEKREDSSDFEIET